jgi:hypothetical protein
VHIALTGGFNWEIPVFDRLQTSRFNLFSSLIDHSPLDLRGKLPTGSALPSEALGNPP